MKTNDSVKFYRHQIFEQLRDILEPWISNIDLINDINEQTNLIADLGLDSVGILQVILGIEKEFGVSIKNHEIDSRLLSAMGNLVNMIQEKVNEANRPAYK
jgi:acyl carrier protein